MREYEYFIIKSLIKQHYSNEDDPFTILFGSPMYCTSWNLEISIWNNEDNEMCVTTKPVHKRLENITIPEVLKEYNKSVPVIVCNSKEFLSLLPTI